MYVVHHVLFKEQNNKLLVVPCKPQAVSHLSQIIPDIFQVTFHHFGIVKLAQFGSPGNQELCLQLDTALLCSNLN